MMQLGMALLGLGVFVVFLVGAIFLDGLLEKGKKDKGDKEKASVLETTTIT